MKTVALLSVICFAFVSAITPLNKQHRFRQQATSGTREACADLLDKSKITSSEVELQLFAECNLPNAVAARAGKEITTPAGFKFKYNGEAQFTQGGFKRLFTAVVTATKAGYPANDVEIVVAVSKLSIEAAYKQLKDEFDLYETNKATVGACPGVMKIYEGWTVGTAEQAQSFYMIFEKINGKNGKFNAYNFFQEDQRLTLKEWAKVTKQMYECWDCVLKAGKYIHDSDAKNMIIDANTDYKLIDLDIKALDGTDTEIKWRRSILATSLRFAGAKRDCFGSWLLSDTGNKYDTACEGVITKATEPQAAKINTMIVTAQVTVGGLGAASLTDVLVDGTLNNDAIDGSKWVKIA